MLFEEFLERSCQDDPSRLALQPGPTRLLLHGHCHQKAMGLLPPARALLSRIPSCTVVDLDAGCCGMAGSFGYTKEHYDVSRQIGERRLLPAARALKDGEVLVASGISCRQQVAHFTGVQATHPATLLRSLLSTPTSVPRQPPSPGKCDEGTEVAGGRRLHTRATTIVLGLLCLMYLITYVDRVNIATAAIEIRKELGLSNTQLGFVLSAFAYPYLLFQVFGGWIGDRFGPRRTLFLCGVIWATATILTGLAAGLAVALPRASPARRRRRRDVPGRDARDAELDAVGRRGFAQGITHAFARLGNAVTPPIVAWLIAAVTWRGSFVTLGSISLIWVVAWVLYFRDNPAEHPAITSEELDTLPNRGVPEHKARPRVPWGPLTRRMVPVIVVYFCYAWTLWLYLNWLPSYFLHEYQRADIEVGAVLVGGVLRGRRRRLPRWRNQRPHPAHDTRFPEGAP